MTTKATVQQVMTQTVGCRLACGAGKRSVERACALRAKHNAHGAGTLRAYYEVQGLVPRLCHGRGLGGLRECLGVRREAHGVEAVVDVHHGPGDRRRERAEQEGCCGAHLAR